MDRDKKERRDTIVSRDFNIIEGIQSRSSLYLNAMNRDESTAIITFRSVYEKLKFLVLNPIQSVGHFNKETRKLTTSGVGKFAKIFEKYIDNGLVILPILSSSMLGYGTAYSLGLFLKIKGINGKRVFRFLKIRHSVLGQNFALISH